MANGRIVSREINGAANTSTWGYDATGRVSDWTNELGTFTPSYVNAAYGVGRLSSVSYPNGQVVNYQWENKTGDFRLKEIENLGAGSGALSKFDYVTDAGNRIDQWTQQAGTATATRYDFGYDAVDQLISAVQKRYYADGWKDEVASASDFLTKDHPGSIREVTDGLGALAARYDYDPHGQVTKLTGSVDSDMLYIGRYCHALSGLFLAPYRAYDPALGRWISRDPIEEEGGINVYRNVGNDPVNEVDLARLDPADAADPGYRQFISRPRGLAITAAPLLWL